MEVGEGLCVCVHRFAHVECTYVFSGAVRESLMEQMMLGGCLKEVRKPAVCVCVHARVQEHSRRRLCSGRVLGSKNCRQASAPALS